MAATIVQSAICKTVAGMGRRPYPTLFYYPGLNSAPFHDTEQLAWCRTLESKCDAIREEFEAFSASKASDYDQREGKHRLHSGSWDWHSYVLKGVRQEAFRRACPTTAALLDQVPGHMLGTPFSYSFFSTLGPGAAIKPHTAPCNLRLRCHLPLAVPTTDVNECGIRVGEQVRPWEVGKCLLFDDAYEHETWNQTTQPRVVLLFDVWHPDLAADERTAIADMFARSSARAAEQQQQQERAAG